MINIQRSSIQRVNDQRLTLRDLKKNIEQSSNKNVNVQKLTLRDFKKTLSNLALKELLFRN